MIHEKPTQTHDRCQVRWDLIAEASWRGAYILGASKTVVAKQLKPQHAKANQALPDAAPTKCAAQGTAFSSERKSLRATSQPCKQNLRGSRSLILWKKRADYDYHILNQFQQPFPRACSKVSKSFALVFSKYFWVRTVWTWLCCKHPGDVTPSSAMQHQASPALARAALKPFLAETAKLLSQTPFVQSLHSAYQFSFHCKTTQPTAHLYHKQSKKFKGTVVPYSTLKKCQRAR